MSDNSSSDTELDLADVMDLSVIELYLLNYLIRIAGSVVRFTVFNEINHQLGEEKSLSRSSFYNSLENLQNKGFVEIDSSETGKKSSVRALPKAKKAIQQVNIFNIWGSVDPDAKFKQLIEKYQSYFSPEEGKNGVQLILSLQYPTNQEMIELLSAKFSHVKLLGDESTIGPISERYELVNVDGKGIVERNNIFDQVIIYRYAYNELRFDFSFKLLIDECLRVVKPGGSIVFLALEDLRTTNNLILEAGIGSVLQETFEKQSTKKLKSLLNNLNIDEEQIVELTFNGLSLIKVTK